MTTQPAHSLDAKRFERTYDAPVELVWRMLTTAAGLEEWFAPDGFETQVNELDLRPDGQLRYTMTATAPEQAAFLRDTGNPLATEVRKTFTEVTPYTRLAYWSLVDFVPNRDSYQHLTTIDIEAAGDRTNVVMTVDPLHDETWTRQHRAHRDSELDNLGAALQRQADHYYAQVSIDAPIATVFAAVSTVDGLSGWWTTDTAGSAEPGGELRFTFTDGTAVMRVDERTSPTVARWTCLDHSGQPEWAQTTVTFRLTEATPGATRLEFTHGGLRPQLDCYRQCSAGWDYLMRSLAAYAETGTGQPVSP